MRIHNDKKVTRWTIDPVQSQISFEVRHLMVSHIKGEFGHFEADVFSTGHDFSTANINLKITSKSINTGDSGRDTRLKGPDFLCTDDHKHIRFKSTSVSRTDDINRLELHGDLSVGGTTRSMKLEIHMGLAAIDSWGDESASLVITGKLTRENWGLRWTTAMAAAGFLVGDEIIILCRLELYSIEQHDAKRQPDATAQARTIIL